MEKEIIVQGMTCGSCAKKVEDALASAPEIESAKVGSDLQSVKLLVKREVKESLLQKLLSSAGSYSLVQERVEKGERGKSKVVLKTYRPLIITFSFVLLLSSVGQINAGAWNGYLFMQHFMGFFFLLFSFFKVLDLSGFANAFRGYDVLAKALPFYAWLYPFIELTLAMAYLTFQDPVLTNAFTIGIMGIGLLGVGKAVLSKRTIQCACLGTGFNLPMTWVTIFENSLMIVMAMVMLLRHV